ncbi:MAG: hypothetical protein EB090_01780 [Verrucomicrobia bacterium]|nr:hypothetical protein [Verrucomicrobiota bacterium]
MSEHSHSLTERKHPYLPGIWLAVGFLGLASLGFLLRPAGVTPEAVLENAAKTRLEKLSKLREEQEKALTSYGWVDKEKGIAHIPIAKAMEQVLPKLRASDPRPAYPITTITPSAIVAAGAPLYPEVPVTTTNAPTLTTTNSAPVTIPTVPAPLKGSNNSTAKKP